MGKFKNWVASVAALVLVGVGLVALPTVAGASNPQSLVCEGTPPVYGHEWQGESRTFVPEVEEVSHQVYSYKQKIEQFKTEYRMAKFVRTKSKTYTKPVAEVKAQHYSWTGKKRDADNPPTVVPPHKDWQANTSHEPHGSEATWVNEYLHYTANSRGHASWFYFTPAIPGVPGGWGEWSDFGEWSKWLPEQHVQWRSAPDPIGSPQKHAEWQEGNTKFYREWQVRHDGQTRQVPDGHTWEYSGEVTEPRDAPWVLLDGYPKKVVTTEHVPAHYTDWTPDGDVVQTDEKVAPGADTDTFRWKYIGTYLKSEAVPPSWQSTDPYGQCYNGPEVKVPPFVDHTCEAVGTLTLPPVEDGIYRISFSENDGIWVGLPAGTYPMVKGLGVFPHDQAGEPIYDLLTVRLHQVSTWPNDPVEEWGYTLTQPEDCEPPDVPEPTVEVEWDEWVTGEYTCEDTTVTQTRTGVARTTTTVIYGEPGNWYTKEVVTEEEVSETRTVPLSDVLTDEELAELERNCIVWVEPVSPVVTVNESQCVDGAPSEPTIEVRVEVVEGVRYFFNDQEVFPEGVIRANHDIEIVAKTDEGYRFIDDPESRDHSNSATLRVYTFQVPTDLAEDCTELPPPPKDEPKDEPKRKTPNRTPDEDLPMTGSNGTLGALVSMTLLGVAGAALVAIRRRVLKG